MSIVLRRAILLPKRSTLRSRSLVTISQHGEGSNIAMLTMDDGAILANHDDFMSCIFVRNKNASLSLFRRKNECLLIRND
jgi:hypothetical protein